MAVVTWLSWMPRNHQVNPQETRGFQIIVAVLRSARNNVQTQHTSNVAQASTEPKRSVCRSIGRICTHRCPGEAFGSSLAVYDLLLLTSLSGNFSVFIDVWYKVTQLHYDIAAQPWGKSCKELWKNTVIGWSGQLKPLDALRTLTEKFCIIQ